MVEIAACTYDALLSRCAFYSSRKSTMILSICSTGGYYSDTPAFVSDSCKRCPNGTFVHKNKAPGKSYFDCSSCSQG